MKEQKQRILAALALVFALGMVVPGMAFASEGSEGENEGIALLAANGQSTVINAASLYNVIDEARQTPNFTKHLNLVNAYNAVTAASPTDADVAAAKSAITAVNDKAQVGDANASELATFIAGMKEYQTWAPAINAMNSIVKDLDVADVNAITSSNISGVPADKVIGYYNAINSVVHPVPETTEENIVELKNRVDTYDSFANYRSALDMVAATLALEKDPMDINAKAKLVAALGGEADKMSVAELIAEARKTPSFDKYAALYNSMGFIRQVSENIEGTLSDTTLRGLLKTGYSAAQLESYYNGFATAAVAIDSNAATGLKSYVPSELPNTGPDGDGNGNNKPGDGAGNGNNGSDVEAPNTGIVGLIETGAIDVATLTLIVSVAVAGVAGLGLIAKLYLKHKF